ncbi:glycosyltransferase [Halegenticoccus tardaugens]|uniref:glycosyltransferase n=1 Tax=Halegenticoccus tardaugens TaxID=2071624 RepID=UPI00100BD0B1|nr:glycosyltransferase family 2 protein [Halegenticoccus tardaugens]
MEVKTAEELNVSVRTIARYVVVASLLTAGLLVPLFVFDAYAQVINTLLLMLLLGLVGRTLVSSMLAFRHVNPVSDVADEDLPTVSVLIPAYNEEPVLQGTIDACKRLDYPREKLEVVICYERASTDGTAEIAERAAAESDLFKAVERDEPGGGKAKATNYALRYVTGDVIASIDADHQFRPDAVRRAVSWFVSDEDIWCVKGRCYGRNPTDSLLALHATVERHIAEKADLFAREVMNGFTVFGGGQAFFRAEVFTELGDFDEEVLVEDIDMSSKIHSAGKELQVDPQVITYEENPATLSAWWSQRSRWARGWMQVAVRYLPTLPWQPTVSLRKRLDAVYTFSYAIVPAFFILALPMNVLSHLTQIKTATFVPDAWVLWTLISIAPVIVSYLIFFQDWRDGERHHPLEYLAAFTLWFYLVFQTIVFAAAFIDEFVLDSPSVYVTTSRTG